MLHQLTQNRKLLQLNVKNPITVEKAVQETGLHTRCLAGKDCQDHDLEQPDYQEQHEDAQAALVHEQAGEAGPSLGQHHQQNPSKHRQAGCSHLNLISVMVIKLEPKIIPVFWATRHSLKLKDDDVHSPREDDEAPSTGQSTMSTRHSLLGPGKQVCIRIQHTGQSLENIPSTAALQSKSPKEEIRNNRFNVTTWSTDANLEDISMINQVNKIALVLPGTALANISTVGMDHNQLETSVNQPLSSLVSNKATKVDSIWPTVTY